MLRSIPGGGDDREADLEAADGPACVLGICDGSGWILRDDGLAEPCECRERMIGRAVSKGMGSGIPKRFRGVSFDRKPIADINPFVLTEVRRYVERLGQHLEDGRGMWFAGDVGTGKTSLAMLIAHKAEQLGHSVAIYSLPRLFAEIRDTYNDDGPSYMQLFRRLAAVDLMLLDDLGTENRTEWVTEQLYAIVNERWQDQRPLLVTSNTTDRDVLAEQIGARTMSRLTEICGGPLPIMGPDLRTTGAA